VNILLTLATRNSVSGCVIGYEGSAHV
jgi:hypothetical protein